MILSQFANQILRKNSLRQEFKTALTQYRVTRAPVTYGLIWVVTTIFAIEVVFTALFGVRSIRVLATGSFKLHPELAWVFAPILHAGSRHFLANVGGLLVLGIPLEQHFTKRRFGSFILATAYLSTLGGWLAQAMFTTAPIAVYGISGTVFALAGYALVHSCRANDRLPAFEWIAMLVGLAAAVTVAYDPITGQYLHPGWINGGHATGMMIGLLVGVVR